MHCWKWQAVLKVKSDAPIFVVKDSRDPGTFYYKFKKSKIKLMSFFCVEHNLKPLVLLEPLPALLKAKDKKYKSPNLIFLIRSFFPRIPELSFYEGPLFLCFLFEIKSNGAWLSFPLLLWKLNSFSALPQQYIMTWLSSWTAVTAGCWASVTSSSN